MTTTLIKQLSLQDKTTFAQLNDKLRDGNREDNAPTLMFYRTGRPEFAGYLDTRSPGLEPLVRAAARGYRPGASNFVIDQTPYGDAAVGMRILPFADDAVDPNDDVQQMLIRSRQAIEPFRDLITASEQAIEQAWLEGDDRLASASAPPIRRAAWNVPVLPYLQALGVLEHCSVVPLIIPESLLGTTHTDECADVRGDVDFRENGSLNRLSYPVLSGDLVRRSDVVDVYAPSQVIEDPVPIGRSVWRLRLRRLYDQIEVTRYVVDSAVGWASPWRDGARIALIERAGIDMGCQHDENDLALSTPQQLAVLNWSAKAISS